MRAGVVVARKGPGGKSLQERPQGVAALLVPLDDHHRTFLAGSLWHNQVQHADGADSIQGTAKTTDAGGLQMTRRLIAALALILISGCTPDAPDALWPGDVIAEVDDLTGARTGMFRTYGPTQKLAAGTDTVPVTVGYYCRLDRTGEPPVHRDGLFFRLSMPDTSLLANDQEHFEELRGQLGLLNVARLAVDGQLYAWEYAPQPTRGGGYLDGAMGFVPTTLTTEADRDVNLTLAAESRRAAYAVEMTELVWAEMAHIISHDYVRTHYIGRDTVGIELKGVLTFPLFGFGAAVDSVRFWCPVAESHLEWDRVRAQYLSEVDSIRTLAQDEIAREEAARRAEAERRRAEAEHRRAEAEHRRAEAEAVALVEQLLGAVWVPDFMDYARENGFPFSSAEDVRRFCRNLVAEEMDLPGNPPSGEYFLTTRCRELSAGG